MFMALNNKQAPPSRFYGGVTLTPEQIAAAKDGKAVRVTGIKNDENSHQPHTEDIALGGTITDKQGREWTTYTAKRIFSQDMKIDPHKPPSFDMTEAMVQTTSENFDRSYAGVQTKFIRTIKEDINSFETNRAAAKEAFGITGRDVIRSRENEIDLTTKTVAASDMTQHDYTVAKSMEAQGVQQTVYTDDTKTAEAYRKYALTGSEKRAITHYSVGNSVPVQTYDGIVASHLANPDMDEDYKKGLQREVDDRQARIEKEIKEFHIPDTRKAVSVESPAPAPVSDTAKSASKSSGLSDADWKRLQAEHERQSVRDASDNGKPLKYNEDSVQAVLGKDHLAASAPKSGNNKAKANRFSAGAESAGAVAPKEEKSNEIEGQQSFDGF